MRAENHLLAQVEGFEISQKSKITQQLQQGLINHEFEEVVQYAFNE